ncbi:MAG: hypothetical protein EA340_01380, partial [Nitriliruptor sp.]
MSDPVTRIVEEHLASVGDAALDEVLRVVRAAGGAGVSRAALERVLVRDPRFAAQDELGRRRWTLVDPSTAEHPDSTRADTRADTR